MNKRFAWILLGIIPIFFIAQNLFAWFTPLFVLNSNLWLIRPWTLVSHIFLHGSGQHLLSNMFALFLFGTILEAVVGSKKFIMIFFVGGILSSIGTILFYNSSLGASGAIFGVMGTLVVLRPKMVIWISYIPMPMYAAAFVWVATDVFGIFVPNGIANIVHLFGLAFGLGFGFYLKKQHGDHVIHREHGDDVHLDDDDFDKWEKKWM